MATAAQTANALITFFCQEYRQFTGETLTVNRHVLKWGFQDLVTDLGEAKAREIIKYFFKTNRTKYDPQSFLSIYDVLNRNYEEQKRDAKAREELRERTRKRVEEAEARERDQT